MTSANPLAAIGPLLGIGVIGTMGVATLRGINGALGPNPYICGRCGNYRGYAAKKRCRCRGFS